MSTINVFQISFEIWGCIIGIIVCILLGTASFETEDVVEEAIEKAVAAVTPEQTAKMKMFYGAIWS